MYKNGLFIFRRDLRIQDNVGLYHAMKSCTSLYYFYFYTRTSNQKFLQIN